ncbi:hypothetical protein EC957_010568 [Mortierella hygrophila]|uniref:F-box domain-containing protein n=1 Tax=Mortierella hygrophila TaxID=979708 RepID=A0A9P6K4E6_9FUNG|nr:hypothetical protein EC957_010568 [Mortierella hygrophila]
MKRFFNQLLRNISLSRDTNTTLCATATTPTKISPLEIPLTLDIIFSYLDDHTCRYRVALVCRQWFLHQQNQFSRTITFSDFWTDKQVALFCTKLPGAGRLECVLHFDSPRGIDTKNIRALLERYQGDYRRQLEKRNQIAINKRKRTLYSFDSLRSISISVGVQYGTTIDSIPFPPSLTSLELTFVFCQSNGESIGKIMRTCPLLEILSLEVEERSRQPMSQITLDQELLPKPLLLQHLKLRNVYFAQADLESLLSFTPRIKSLKLIGLDTLHRPKYDWMRLLEHIKALRITLEDVYFFEYGQQSHLDIMPRLGEICPTIGDWTLWAPDVTPSLLQELTLRTSFVTTLELFWEPMDYDYAALCCSDELKHAPRLIHEYLCTSSQIVHLKSLKTVIRPEFMDLFNRRDPHGDPLDLPTTPAPALWACRGLETLHVELHDKHCSRTLFGYVSRVLPQLQELFVRIPELCKPNEDSSFIYPVMHVNLQGGLCLLSQLKHLRRLRVATTSHDFKVTDGCSKMDLNWMLPSGRNGKFKRQRRDELKTWRVRRDEEDQRETMRSLQQQQPPRIEKEADTEIWSQLRNLGLLLDVEEVVKEIDAGGREPLPSLEKLSFSLNTLGMKHPEVELKNIFRDRKK